MRCLRPLRVRDPAYPHLNVRMQVPCGKCYACRTNQRTEWTVRASLELQYSAWSLFVTLTYDDEHCPRNDCGVLEVEKRDVQTWLKRFRKWLTKYQYDKVRYFITSEYGEGLRRPHYHCLLFFGHLSSRKLATFDAIETSWGNGQVNFGDVTTASIHYCMKYLMKFDEEVDPLPTGINKPFRLMSRKPAIGLPWLDPLRKDYYVRRIANDDPCTVLLEDRELALPRYLKNKCLKLPWDIPRSSDFHLKVAKSDEDEEVQQYNLYTNEISNPLDFDQWQIAYPRYKRLDRLDTMYKDAYIKHLREHLINL